jgi:hypothetical protein
LIKIRLQSLYMKFLSLLFSFWICTNLNAQQITGYWHGKIGNAFGVKTELKLILKGDSLVGTNYYYFSKNSYVRYSVKGYFNQFTNAVIWWDDVLIETKSNKLFPSNKKEMLRNEANFNCPGDGTMKLEGSAQVDEAGKTLSIKLDKKNNSVFADEWNEIIDNWTNGGNSIAWIESVQYISKAKIEKTENTIPYHTETVNNVKTTELDLPVKKQVIATEKVTDNKPIEFLEIKKELIKPSPIVSKKADAIETKFAERKKIVLVEIPLADSIEMNFYDNAEVDGDSISLFLDNKLLLQHIRLSNKPFTVKLTKEQLTENTEITMVAENLGSIPPNTSFMVAYVNGKRYEATLSSNEQSSAVIRFRKSN